MAWIMLQGVVEIVQERALSGTARVHRLQGHHHAELLGQRHQFLECALDELSRVVEGVAGPRAAAHHQAPGAQRRGRSQGLGRVFHAFAIAVALAAREPPRPEQMRNLQVVLPDQFQGAILAAIGKLLPPDADGLDPRRGIMGHVVFERPAKGRGFVQGQDCHPCRLQERETIVWRIVRNSVKYRLRNAKISSMAIGGILTSPTPTVRARSAAIAPAFDVGPQRIALDPRPIRRETTGPR